MKIESKNMHLKENIDDEKEIFEPELDDESDFSEDDEITEKPKLIRTKIGALCPELLINDEDFDTDDSKYKVGGSLFSLYLKSKDIIIDPSKERIYDLWLRLCDFNSEKSISDVKLNFARDLLSNAEMRMKFHKKGLIESIEKLNDDELAKEAPKFAGIIFDKASYEDKSLMFGKGIKGKNSKLNFKDVVDLMTFRRDKQQKNELRLRKELPKILEKVEFMIWCLIEQYNLDVNPEKLENILKNVPIYFMDSLVTEFERGFQGSFSPNKMKIRLSSELDKEEIISILVHELFHALSGKSYMSEAEGDEIYYNSENIINNKNGLSFWSDKRGNLFTWLDEAITEKLTLMAYHDWQLLEEIGSGKRISGMHYNKAKNCDLAKKNCSVLPGSYRVERQILDILLSRIDFSHFQAAYFEDYDLELAPELRMAKFRKLHSLIREKFGEKFLVKLDKCYREKRSLRDFMKQVM